MDADIERQIAEIYRYMLRGDNYQKGVTNKDVKKEFTEAYDDAWRILKGRKKLVFFEEGKWFRWFN